MFQTAKDQVTIISTIVDDNIAGMRYLGNPKIRGRTTGRNLWPNIIVALTLKGVNFIHILANILQEGLHPRQHGTFTYVTFT